MSTSAVVMMIIAIVLVWGGLVAAIMKLRTHPEPPESEADDVVAPRAD